MLLSGCASSSQLAWPNSCRLFWDWAKKCRVITKETIFITTFIHINFLSSSPPPHPTPTQSIERGYCQHNSPSGIISHMLRRTKTFQVLYSSNSYIVRDKQHERKLLHILTSPGALTLLNWFEAYTSKMCCTAPWHSSAYLPDPTQSQVVPILRWLKEMFLSSLRVGKQTPEIGFIGVPLNNFLSRVPHTGTQVLSVKPRATLEPTPAVWVLRGWPHSTCCDHLNAAHNKTPRGSW